MRRLLQMEKTSGIWTQKMQMRIERKSVVILDHENGVGT
jgi:epidermal growth factor receptor kinase substrate 8